MNDLTETFVMGRLITDDDSLRNYYLGDSYQMQDISAKVAGPFNYPLSSSCDTSQLTSTLKPMVDAQVGGTSQNYLWFFGSQTELVRLERPGVGRHAAEAVGEHLVQPFGRLRRPGAGAWAQLRHAALVVAEVRDQQHAGRPEQRLHGERVRRFIRSDGRRLPPHERLAEVLPGLAVQLQRRPRDQQRNVQPGSVRDGVQRHAVPADQGAARAAVHAAGGGRRRRDRPRTSTTTTSSCARRSTSTARWAAGAVGARARAHGDGPAARARKGPHTFLLDMAPSTSSFNDAALAVGQTYTDPAGGLSFTVHVGQQLRRDDRRELHERRQRRSDLHGRHARSPRRGRLSIRHAPATPASTGAGGTTGAGGRGGTTGTAGAGGRGGTTGSAGTTGNAGRGGTTGSAGRGGTTGAAGTGGSETGAGRGADAGRHRRGDGHGRRHQCADGSGRLGRVRL